MFLWTEFWSKNYVNIPQSQRILSRLKWNSPKWVEILLGVKKEWKRYFFPCLQWLHSTVLFVCGFYGPSQGNYDAEWLIVYTGGLCSETSAVFDIHSRLRYWRPETSAYSWDCFRKESILSASHCDAVLQTTLCTSRVGMLLTICLFKVITLVCKSKIGNDEFESIGDQNDMNKHEIWCKAIRIPRLMQKYSNQANVAL